MPDMSCRMFFVAATTNPNDADNMDLCCCAFNHAAAAKMWKAHYAGWGMPERVIVFDLITPAAQGPVPWQMLPNITFDVKDL